MAGSVVSIVSQLYAAAPTTQELSDKLSLDSAIL
jgi:hypothetical protein